MTDTTRPRPFVFVLMPFSEEFDDTYRMAIKPACERAGAFAERVDEQIFDGSILYRVYNQISKADIIVADMTGRNPNVFYETGYAHALGKKTLLITRSADDIPFDLKHFPHIVYGGKLSNLLPELEKRVRWHIENPEKEQTSSGDVLIRINEVPWSGESDVVVPHHFPADMASLAIDVHNTAGKSIRTLSCQVGIVAPEGLDQNDKDKVDAVRLGDGRILHLFSERFSLLPGSWKTMDIRLMRGDHFRLQSPLGCTVKVLTESGVIDFPFILRQVE